MKQMEWAAQVRDRISEPLRALVADIERDIPGVRSHPFMEQRDTPRGTRIHVGVSCILSDSDEPDLVDLSISIEGTPTTASISNADVCWGHPSGYIELELVREPVELTEETLNILVRGLPDLVRALKDALRRGLPANRVQGER